MINVYTKDIREELKGNYFIAVYDLQDATTIRDEWLTKNPTEITTYEDDIGETTTTPAEQVKQYNEEVIPAALKRVEIYKFLLSKFAETDMNNGASSGAGVL